jgi:signal recognition particle receptor subunit beta
MPLLNNLTREIGCKIVYYGPALSGKTTNLLYIHSQLAPAVRGELVSLATMTDRTLFFDFLPLDVGEIQGWKLKFALYTVPGQIEYAANRKLILNGADCVVYVADSDPLRRHDNKEYLQTMLGHMDEFGMTLDAVPLVLQYNKRDLVDAMSLDEMEIDCNYNGVPSFESVATTGLGVFSTLRAVSRLMIERLTAMVS